VSLEAPAEFRGPFRVDEPARAVYSEAAGIGRALPTAVAVPLSLDDVTTLVRWARDGGHTLIPRGSGSSMASAAIGRGVVVDLSRFRALHDPDSDARSIRADAGVLRGEVDRRAASVGLRFPVDPSSGEFCTIGGMTATNAAGPHSLRHGSMRPWVLGVTCVFDDGSTATIRRGEQPPSVPAIDRFLRDVAPSLLDLAGGHSQVRKDSSGYGIAAYAQTHELIDLLVGSEGTLALFTGMELALIPVHAATASLLVSFGSLEAAVEAAIACREGGAAACELLDRTFLGIASKGGRPLPVSAESEAVLLIEVESFDAPAAAADIDRLRTAVRSAGAVDVIASATARDATELWSLRHAASPALARMDASLRSMQFVEDAAVPPQALGEYVRGVRKILERNDTLGVIFGHAGDAHVHVNPLVDVRRADWRQRVEAILLDVTALVARLEGTLTGEHGDGRLRTPLLDHVWDARWRDAFARVKRSFDPTNVFNPGVKVALEGQRAIDVVKYDPDIAALPAQARAALDIVDHERAYSRFRLDLLSS
jgi:FAD/FMN-containing dehydrogenase